MTAYATEADALAQFPGAAKPTGDNLARLVALLPVAAEQLNRAAQRDWYRHPANDYDGPDEWFAEGEGKGILHVHGGIVSLEAVDLRYSESSDYEEVDPVGWALRGTDPYSDEPDADGLPYFHVVLTRISPSTHGIFPRGIQSVRLTGVRGYDTPPADLVQANVERARQLYSAESTYSGGTVATDAMGNPVTTFPGLPASFYAFLRAENSRFLACHL